MADFRLGEQLEWMLSMARWIIMKEQDLKLTREFMMTIENIRANLEVLQDMNRNG